MKSILLTLLAAFVVSSMSIVHAQTGDPRLYDIGTPTLTDVYVDPVSGDDNRAGDTPETALRTISAAWDRIPMGEALTTGVHIHLAAGVFSADMQPNYWESRFGTYEHPIILSGTGIDTRLATINLFNSHYVYFMDFLIDEGVDAFHCELCDHVLLRGVTLRGAAPETYQAQEVVKVNQSTYFYLENSDISGAWNVVVDFVAVQHGHVIGNRIHEAGDWCIYFKGGSAYLSVEANDIFNCVTGGFSAGQGTGFQYMVPPFIQYEAYYIWFVNNHVSDTTGAGVGVQGGYNVLIAHNTFTRIGARSHMVDIIFGSRSCDGAPDSPERPRCESNAALGGWGNMAIADGENYVRIPNRHVYIINNIFNNPAGYRSEYQHLNVFAPYAGDSQIGSGVPVPTLADDDLRIIGNLIWNGDASHPIGVGYEDTGCAADHPTCSEAQIRRDNAINTIAPEQSAALTPLPLPSFIADDGMVPPPDSLQYDFSGSPVAHIGAF